MARTIRRQPFSVSTDADNFSKSYFFNQTQFKGLCDNKNDVSIDQSTFSDVQNMYVDENGVLTSRPPFKFYDGEGYIVDQWLFGEYGLRLYKILVEISEDKDGKLVASRVDELGDQDIESLYFYFAVESITHSTVHGTFEGKQLYGSLNWVIPVTTIGWDSVPKVTCAQVEDKIFIWFANVDFMCFNTTGIQMSNGTIYRYFENAVKYLYFPVHKLVINGIESDLETKNFLTNTYKRRYQYSALSTVNFEKLAGRQMSVNMIGDLTQNKSKHLYDIIVQERQEKMLVYPYSPIGGNYHIDIAQTARATVVLRYSNTMHTIEVSFDGKYFRALPSLDDIIGTPMLTRDGLWAVAFTKKGVAKCKLVAQETIDFVDADTEEMFKWTVEPYMRNLLLSGFPAYLDTINQSFVPAGYFETIDQFAYVFWGPSIYTDISDDSIPYLYAEWPNGSNDIVWGYNTLIDINETGTEYCKALQSDDIKVHFRYVAPTLDHKDVGAVISIMTPNLFGFNEANKSGKLMDSCVMFNFFKQNENAINRTLQNNDRLYVTEFLGNKRDESAKELLRYVHRMNTTGMRIVYDENKIYSGDVIICTPNVPYNISDTEPYDPQKDYNAGDYCINDDYVIFRCLQNCKGQTPPTIPDNLSNVYNNYWTTIPNPSNTKIVMRSKIKMMASYSNTSIYWYEDWKLMWLRYSDVRYKIEAIDGSTGTITPNKRVRLRSFDLDIAYSPTDLRNICGDLIIYNATDHSVYSTNGWNLIYPQGISVLRMPDANIYTGNAVILGAENPAKVDRLQIADTGIDVSINGTNYLSQGYSAPCRQFDVQAAVPTLTAESIKYEFTVAYSILGKNESNQYDTFDHLWKIEYEYITDKFTSKKENSQLIHSGASWFRIMPNAFAMLTDKYFFGDKEIISLPMNGDLFPRDTDKERSVANNDNLVLAITDANDNLQMYDSNIHKMNADGVDITSGRIQSGDVVSYTKNANTEAEYTSPVHDGTSFTSNRFYIERLVLDEDGNLVGAVGGELKSGDLIRLRAYDKNIVLPSGHPGNPNAIESFTIEPYTYPKAPDGWKVGDDWPSSFPTYPPIFANADGTLRQWAPGDPLPTGPILMYGVVNIYKKVRPICLDGNGVWYNIDGTLWTSQTSTENTLELDEYVNSELQDVFDEKGNLISSVRTVDVNTTVPDAYATMNEHYFSYFYKGRNLLEITATRRDENKLFSDEGTDLLLYMPKRNEQPFANKITALHPLSDTEIGIFTEKDVWYISNTTLNDGTIAYTKPVKSKIPVGLREGNHVITALDGQALIFPTPRGLVALAPQDFVATTEKTLTYLTDAIQEKYYSFYNDGVEDSSLIPEEFEFGHKPFISINTYKYWIIMHKYLDREIYALDTRDGTWWRWTTPYPIRSIMVGSRLHVLMQINFSPITQPFTIVEPAKYPSLMGVSFVFADKEVDDVTYWDSTVSGALNGLATLIHENEHVGDRRILHQASPIIDWYFTSQRLHFDQINNYKAIKAINFNVKGDETITAKLFTKAFRSLYHPEQSETIEVKMNDIRTFVKRFNLMHVIDFQYKIAVDRDTDASRRRQFKLNALSIKYEVKERIR